MHTASQERREISPFYKQEYEAPPLLPLCPPPQPLGSSPKVLQGENGTWSNDAVAFGDLRYSSFGRAVPPLPVKRKAPPSHTFCSLSWHFLNGLFSLSSVFCFLEAPDETTLKELAETLQQKNIEHVLWLEQPENIATCLALRPYPKEEVSQYLKKFRLFKWPMSLRLALIHLMSAGSRNCGPSIPKHHILLSVATPFSPC